MPDVVFQLFTPAPGPLGQVPHWLPWLGYLSGPASYLYLGFWIWMLVHCIRNDPERMTWLWILIILPGIGPFVYFFARYLPGTQAEMPALGFVKRFTSGRQLAKLEHAAKNIGNAHQWLELADLQREVGKPAEAAQSYRKALQKDGTYLPALWGAAQTELVLKNLPDARGHLQTILNRDFTYKFGDVSLAYGRVLFDLNETDAARTHLVSHLQRWTHPEAHYLMAPAAARDRRPRPGPPALGNARGRPLRRAGLLRPPAPPLGQTGPGAAAQHVSLDLRFWILDLERDQAELNPKSRIGNPKSLLSPPPGGIRPPLRVHLC